MSGPGPVPFAGSIFVGNAAEAAAQVADANAALGGVAAAEVAAL